MSQKNNFKQQLRNDIVQKLDSSLSELKSQLGEKDFTERVKKAAKMLIDGIKAPIRDNVQEPVKKKAPKKKVAPILEKPEPAASETPTEKKEAVDKKTNSKTAAVGKSKKKK